MALKRVWSKKCVVKKVSRLVICMFFCVHIIYTFGPCCIITNSSTHRADHYTLYMCLLWIPVAEMAIAHAKIYSCG